MLSRDNLAQERSQPLSKLQQTTPMMHLAGRGGQRGDGHVWCIGAAVDWHPEVLTNCWPHNEINDPIFPLRSGRGDGRGLTLQDGRLRIGVDGPWRAQRKNTEYVGGCQAGFVCGTSDAPTPDVESPFFLKLDGPVSRMHLSVPAVETFSNPAVSCMKMLKKEVRTALEGSCWPEMQYRRM